MKKKNIFSYVLAAVLQFAPLARWISPVTALTSSPMAMILRWAMGSVAVAGTFHGVSAASSVTPTSVTGTNGITVSQKFTVADPEYPSGPKSYSATGLPPGLSIIQSGASRGVVTGTPTKAGVYNATVIGWELSPPGGHNSPHAVKFTILTTGTPPTVTVDPLQATVAEGGVLTLTANTSNNGPFTFQWLNGDLEISKAPNSTLVFNPIKLTETGSYKERVANGFGTVFSAVVPVTVTPARPTISSSPKSIAIHAGESFELTVGVGGAGPFTYQWLSNNIAMPGGTASTYAVSKATPAVSANYAVRVTNGGGTSTSDPATVLVANPLALLAPSLDGAGVITLSFTGLTNRLYTVEAAPGAAGSWQALGANVPGNGGVSTVSDNPGVNTPRFYRVKTAN
ncbi:MAG TPA: immunoglobulin domain-containing protein [Candidatus Limnocylindria bacterium]|nr:immunoglobulin domain-containing protein [Candidatus Limnocylindria bacterium]